MHWFSKSKVSYNEIIRKHHFYLRFHVGKLGPRNEVIEYVTHVRLQLEFGIAEVQQNRRDYKLSFRWSFSLLDESFRILGLSLQAPTIYSRKRNNSLRNSLCDDSKPPNSQWTCTFVKNIVSEVGYGPLSLWTSLLI